MLKVKLATALISISSIHLLENLHRGPLTELRRLPPMARDVADYHPCGLCLLRHRALLLTRQTHDGLRALLCSARYRRPSSAAAFRSRSPALAAASPLPAKRIEYLRTSGKQTVFSAAISPAATRLAQAYLEIMQQEPEHHERLWADAEKYRAILRNLRPRHLGR